jgi:hypothetical protein
MIVLILTIGLLNLALGLTLGCYLGFGPPGLLALWDALGVASAHGSAGPLADDEEQPAQRSEGSGLPGAGMDPELVAAEMHLVEELSRLRAAWGPGAGDKADEGHRPDQVAAAAEAPVDENSWESTAGQDDED